MNRADFILLLDDSMPHQARAAIARILEEEQGESDHQHDAGGYTKWGITSRWYPDVSISDLTAEEAGNIYFRDFWQKCRCSELPPDLALLVFDAIVNQGASFAAKSLQKILKLKADGIIGSKTIKAANDHNSVFLLTQYTRARCKKYCDIAQENHTQIDFIEGWIDRALDVYSDALTAVLYGAGSS